ncbi:hypothetical protein CARUB_v10011222mg [Capsella rubella]|uniref:DUF674 domain-containing protein n=1 Tax=Capsella rubella TaxID=81985 RepID=R0I517_9BRAS|nr:hypothetical protein CARUB_v10011222mg [Capsella rubella]
MAGTESSEKPIFKLTLLVDTEKNKVVLAEVGKDFVDVLFGFLALPMGTIVRLLEKYKENPAPIGCFSHLYKSVVDMDKDDFMTEACKDLLLYPRHVKEKLCRQLKINIDDDDHRSNLRTDDECKVPEGGCDEFFVTPKKAFIITDNMDEVKHASMIHAGGTLLRLGYNDLSMLKTMSVDVNHEEKHISCGVPTSLHDMPTLRVKDEGEAGPDGVVSLTAFIRKQDMKILYAESGKDFVDLVFSFLAIPLESVWEVTGGNFELGCVGNFCKSMKTLSSSGGNASSYTCILPREYRLYKSLLGACYRNDDDSFKLIPHSSSGIEKRGATYIDSDGQTICIPKSSVEFYDFKQYYRVIIPDEFVDEPPGPVSFLVECPTVPVSSGFVKSGEPYVIFDDLTIPDANSWSTLSLLKKLDTNLDDIEKQVINITEAEYISDLKRFFPKDSKLETLNILFLSSRFLLGGSSMAGAESSEKPVFSLRLLVDKKKNKVVLAEAGCFNNLYKSVVDMGTANFMTEACKDLLLYPRSLMDNQRRGLNLNIDDIEILKDYTCPNHYLYYSNFRSSRCGFCGALMTKEFKPDEEIFVSHKPLFTITDNLKVGFTSISHTLKTLKVSGYSGADQLHGMHVEVDHEKVLALLKCLFSSDTPLTDVFLKKDRSCVISKVLNMSSLAVQEKSGGLIQSNNVMSVSVFTRKLDKKVLYIESEKDFVDLLLTFLVLPLNSAWKLAGSNLVLGCIDNLCESFKSLSSIEVRNALNNKCMLPWYYSCQQPLLDVCYADRDTNSVLKDYILVKPRDPKCGDIAEVGGYSGFVKRGTMFMVSDDLTITPMDLLSAICSLKKWNLDFDDMEERVITISTAEAIRLLRASLVTSNALNTVFESLLLKKPKEEI